MTSEVNSSAIDRSKRRFFDTVSQETLASFAFFLTLVFFWGVRYGDYLYAVQENSLFLYNGEFFWRWLQVPEGGLCYLTAYVIQFFYYPLLGGVILALLASITQVLLARLTRVKGAAYLLSFIPSALVAVSTTWSGYYIYLPYELPMVFSELFAIPIALGGYFIYRLFSKSRFRAIVGLLLCAALYPLAGFWGVFVGALGCVDEIGAILSSKEDKKSRKRAILTAIALALGSALIPWVYYRACYFSSVLSVNVYLQGLFEDVRYDKNSITSRFFYGTAALAPLTVFLLLLVTRVREGLPKKTPSLERLTRREARLKARIVAKESKKSLMEKNAKVNKGSKYPVVNLTSEEINLRVEREQVRARVRLLWELWIVIVACVFVASYHTKSFFTVLKATRALVDENWEEVLRIEESNPFPNKACVQFRNLALAYTGRLTESFFERPVAGLSTLSLTDLDYTKSLGSNPYYKLKFKLYNLQRETEIGVERVLCELLYCYWGQTNIAARIAMNNLIATEDRSISFTRTLAIAALVNGEENLARRYLSTLSQTIFYKDWARIRLAFIESPFFYEGVRDFHNDAEFDKALWDRRRGRNQAATLEEAARRFNVEPSAVEAAWKSIQKMRVRRPVHNYVTTSKYPNLVFLYEVVRDNEYDESPKERQEVVLISALVQRKGDFFLEHIEPIMKQYPNGGAPKVYEQGYATWRYYNREGQWDDCEYKFSPETVDLFSQFLDYLHEIQKIPGASISSPDVQETIRNHCRGLYWGYASDESVFRQY